MRQAFTLIELLVVVTIIVVLLAMLMPAMDKAIRQTEMAVCATQLRGVGSAVVVYANEYKRSYPHRPGVHDPNMKGIQPRHLTNSGVGGAHQNPLGYDDRPMYRPYFSLKTLLCPLTEELDLDSPSSVETTIFVSYAMWFGWQFRTQDGGVGDTGVARGVKQQPGMFKLGQRWGYEGERFDILAGDSHAFVAVYGHSEVSHPDSNGVLPLSTKNSEDWGVSGKSTISTYAGPGAGVGTFDWNFVRTDGSVQRIERVFHRGQKSNEGWDVFRWDPRVSRVPYTNWETIAPSYTVVPKGQ